MASTPPPLIWPDGRLMRPETLAREISAPTIGSVRQKLSGHPSQGMDPVRLGRTLRAAENGDEIAYFELAEDMEEKDLHYLSVLGTRKRAVCQLPIEVEPAGDDEQSKADAELVRKFLDRDTLELELFDILDAIGKCRSACELIWDTRRVPWVPKAIKWRDPRWFEYDRVTGEELLLRGDGPSKLLPAAKFIVHHHQAKSGLPIRGGLARAVAWAWMFKNYAIKDWVIFLEAYGHPLRLGKYGNNETEANKRILGDALAQLGTDAWATIPETMMVEFIDRKAGTAPNELWKAKAEYWDAQISKAVLGQTGTTDMKQGGLGDGGNKVHDEVRGDIERADAKLLAATLNRDLVVPLVMFNHGPRDAYPKIRIGRPDPVDVQGEVAAAEKLVAMGVQIGGEQMRDRAGLPAPEAGEEPLRVGSAGPGTPYAADGDVSPGGVDQVQNLALNGAQIKSLLELVQAVEAGSMSPTTARGVIKVSFPSVTDDQIELLLAEAGKIKPAPQEPENGPGVPGGPLAPENPETALLDLLKTALGGNGSQPVVAARNGAADRDPDGIDRAVDEALDDWEEIMRPLRDPIYALIDGAGSLEEVRDGLAAQLMAMDATRFHAVLSQAAFGSRLLGEFEAQGDTGDEGADGG